jgi:hypothetical protein
MWYKSLLEQFVEEECTPYVKQMISRALDAAETGASPALQHFEFNRFDLTIDAEEGMVTLQDVLDATAAGSQQISLHEFAVAINSASS